MGGTGLQHVFLGTGDDVFWSDGNGNPTVPPAAQIANPNPLPGTNNQYASDGRFSNCSDPVGSPGVLPIVRYLHSVGDELKANCDRGPDVRRGSADRFSRTCVRLR
jgi:phospholipase C